MSALASRDPDPGALEAGARAALRTQAALAGRVVAPWYPISNFIAVNPLSGLEDRPFEQALTEAGTLLGARGTLDESQYRAAYAAGELARADLLGALRRRCPGAAVTVSLSGRAVAGADLLVADLEAGPPSPAPRRGTTTLAEQLDPALAALVDDRSGMWCGAFCDAGQAAWSMPDRHLGFYRAWRELAHRDPRLPRSVRNRLAALAPTPEGACLEALDRLGIEAADHRRYLGAHLTQLPGWAGLVRWWSEHRSGLDLVDYLAMRLSYEASVVAERSEPWSWTSGPASPPAGPSDQDRADAALATLGLAANEEERQVVARLFGGLAVHHRAVVWLEAAEGRYRDRLLAELAAERPTPQPQPIEAQLVCCIDVRSEGLRRHLEELGPYETLGFAGFFAVAMRYQDLAGGSTRAQCPVLVEPRHLVTERPAPGSEVPARRRLAGLGMVAGAGESFHAAKDELGSPFVLAEASGWVAGPLAALRTLAPGPFASLRERLGQRVVPPAATVVAVDDAMSEEERGLFAEVALTTMGLTEGFSRLVVLCGHGSTTENNPFAAALDCGACGGQRGGPNARSAAALLNEPGVRRHLASRGIEVPDETWFVAAEHDTATDVIELLDPHLVPADHQPALGRLAGDLVSAGHALAVERCASLPGARIRRTPRAAGRHVRRRSSDWAQVFPEWGLAANAAFVVGPRRLTAHLDLERRVFLHSYRAEVDPAGTALETILTAPMVVAQWINAQYYFSTVDPEHFGSGTKTVHNVVGALGVLSGHNGDLRVGLPHQSVAVGSRLVHEPLRLLTVVEAPIERLEAVIDRNPILQQLFGNGWVALAARAGPGAHWLRCTPHGWEPWATSEESP